MVFFRQLAALLLFSFILVKGNAQSFTSHKQKKIGQITDTLVLDSLTIVPGSLNILFYPKLDSANFPEINYKLHALIFKNKKPDSLNVSYRTFPYNLEHKFYHKDASSLYTDFTRRNNPFTINYNNNSNRDDLFQNDGLNKNGNISRGISFGNNQDVVVNSNLNLQVSGKLTPEIDLVMAATDNNIPFQADGTTAQLQEFDKVFIQLNNHNTKMVVGDYQLSKPTNSYFMNFYKRAQGFYLDNVYNDSTSKNPLTFKTQISGAVSRGKFSRQAFFGTESNQGPYRLKGADNEPFIIILSGTEKIYIDGKLLQRGQENDYIIDYNTGEITFTAKQIITKDKRIVTEFQYAERNYARSLFFVGEEIASKKSKIYFNYFSEQDNKNRSLQQNLDSAQKSVLINIGDSLNDAVSSGAELAEFNNSDVFYKLRDTVVNNILYKNVYIYSTNPDSAKYRLRFSSVGVGKGNYNQISSTANGRVYIWSAPLNGVLQGSYEPVIPLVTPKQNQMFTAGYSYSATVNHVINVEGVYTKNDINRFSTSDKGNDEGSGVKIQSKNQTIFKTDTLNQETKLIYNLNYEFVQKQFVQIERFRNIEFDRDWNRPLTGTLLNDQHIASAEIGLMKTNVAGITYILNRFNEGNNYLGLRHNINANYQTSGFKSNYNGSYLTTDDDLNQQRTKFYRHKTSVSQKIEGLRFSYSDDFEQNLFANQTGSLLPRAYQFWEWEGSVSNADSSKNSVKVFYKERRDRLAYTNELKDSTFATNIGLRASIYSIKNNPFSILVTYRKLELKNKNLVGTFLKPDNTLLNRLEYNPKYFKGLITSNMFYETGYGLENKREFYYLEVAPGQGQYAWLDYNENGIKEINEFETALFNDQARYIKINTPTNQYVKVLQNQFSLSLNIRPSSLLKSPKKKIQHFANRWIAQTVFRLDNKISDNKNNSNYNPFADIKDSLILASGNNVRQSLFFNQSSSVFGADYTYLNNKSKQLLTNGIEKRLLESHEIKWRYNFQQAWAINSDNILSQKENNSQFFTNRNYRIKSLETEQRVVFQPNTVFRISAIYKYTEKRNTIQDAFQTAFLNTYALELKYNQTEKSSLAGRVDFIKIKYNDIENSSVAYEMLNGLNVGDNYTWELNYQRNLNNNIQISINYNGRKTSSSNIVHLGGAQVRAFF